MSQQSYTKQQDGFPVPSNNANDLVQTSDTEVNTSCPDDLSHRPAHSPSSPSDSSHNKEYFDDPNRSIRQVYSHSQNSPSNSHVPSSHHEPVVHDALAETSAHQVSSQFQVDSLNRSSYKADSDRQFSQVNNILVFGETGVGKSSLIKMLCNPTENLPIISGEMVGCTTDTRGYWIAMGKGNAAYRIWDTPGLNEGEYGTIAMQDALRSIHARVEGLAKEGQYINLLIYCIRASEYREYLRVNYDLVAKIICERKVPVVAVINGLENEDKMDEWWKQNHKQFEKHMAFEDHVCVTTTKGKMDGSHFVFQNEYDESRGKVIGVIKETRRTKSWAVINSATFDEKQKKYMEGHNSRTDRERNLIMRFVASIARLKG